MVINRDSWNLPSGKRLQFANWKIAIEIMDLTIKNLVIFQN